MSSRSRSSSLAVLALLLSPCTAFAGKPDVAAGKKLYLANCSMCHGEQGDGKGPGATALKTPPRNFTAGAWLAGTSAEDLFQMMSAGLPASGMPSFQALPETDRRAIAAFIKTLKK
jgi:high-affinity iron transporter